MIDNKGGKYTPVELSGVKTHIFWLETRNNNKILSIYYENIFHKFLLHVKFFFK